MPDLLIELFSEEIPARMQKGAREGFTAEVTKRLAAAGFTHGEIEAHVTPRRIVLHVPGIPAAQAPRTEERKGPKVGAPEQAVQGFLRSAGLASLDEAENRDGVWFAVKKIDGAATADVLPKLVGDAIMALAWPKSMRWRNTRFNWVRPLRSIIALYDGKVLAGGLQLGVNREGGVMDGWAAGPATEGDANFVPFGNSSIGHRFLAPAVFTVTDFADYKAKLAAAKVMLNAQDRWTLIDKRARELAAERGFALVDDLGLLDEVGGLVEWPVPLIGTIDQKFMDLPAEVPTTSMRSHQKYFALRTTDGKLAPHFIVVANIETADKGAAIVAGNERVLRARLSDARFFWDQDRKVRLEDHAAKLKDRVFHAKLGTVADRVERLAKLAPKIATGIGADHAAQQSTERAARLAKADLSTGMVGEFPELQGVMGRYYALNQGETSEVADAIAAHYSPLGPSDQVPSAPVSVALALAEKIDALAGFFSIDEKPTGSKDPFALRRAGLGILRLITENGLRLSLLPKLELAYAGYDTTQPEKGRSIAADILAFLHDRLKVMLREQGAAHDLIAAVMAGEDDVVRLRARLDALAGFLGTETGADLLAAYRRGANILKIEEKKDGTTYAGPADAADAVEPEEKALIAALGSVRTDAAVAVAREDFAGAMAEFGKLRGPVDAFFAKVTVNADDRKLRQNRLRLLAEVRDIFATVADFSKIES